MDTDKKLYVAVAVLAVMGGAVYMQNKKQSAEAEAHSVEAVAETLPKIKLTEDQVKTIDRVELTKPSETDGGAPTAVVLVKKGDEAWDLAEPRKAKGNASNVKSLLDNLTRLDVSEEISPNKDDWGKFDLTDDKALHAVFKKGEEVLLDLYFGENGSRGQMTRVAGKDGVYAVKGYSGFLYNRDASGWRDKKIFEFDEKAAVKITIDNENGEFVFDKDGEAWKGTFAEPKKKPKEIEEYDKAKVESLVRAYKSLNAADFGDDKKPADVGLDEPTATITIELKGGSGKHVLTVGDNSEGSNRWVMKNGSDQIFSVSSWTADWATANVEKFQKSDEPAKPPGGAPPMGMPGMPGMPQGMPPGH
jgi:hypothetical protein